LAFGWDLYRRHCDCCRATSKDHKVKFSGELKFPEIDHPGVPVQFVIDGAQAELAVEGESLGRWSLYDVHARRLVASAFLLDLDGTEVTFVAADPIDFAYRGVEHMAQEWASIKSKRVGGRSLAVRKSRRGTIPSRLDDLREAMESNLRDPAPKRLAGEPLIAGAAESAATVQEDDSGQRPADWDQRDPAGAIPVVSDEATPEPGISEEGVTEDVSAPAISEPALTEQQRWLEEEKARIAEERARLEEERRAAELREANLLEAYRLEMERLESERAEVRRQAAEASAHAERLAAEESARETADRDAAERAAEAKRLAAEEAARAAAERASLERRQAEDAAREAEERAAAAVAEAQRQAEEAAEEAKRQEAEEAERRQAEEAERQAAQEAAEEAKRVKEAAGPRHRAPEAKEEASSSEEPPARKVVDLNDLEEGPDAAPDDGEPSTSPEPEPALAGASKDKGGGGLMGAVKAAFRGGSRDHEHQFVEAPGGIGITRYVCEECGYVSISVAS
jgi:hypothetical protein